MKYHKANLVRVGDGEGMFVPVISFEEDEEDYDRSRWEPAAGGGLAMKKPDAVPLAVHTGARGGRLAWFGWPQEPAYAPFIKALCVRSPAAEEAAKTECVICLHAMGADTALCQIEPCGHQYHAACLDSWKDSCPACRGPQGSVRALPPGTEPRTSFPKIHVGARVRLQGLVGSAALNGRTGSVLSFDEEQGRYAVGLLVAYSDDGKRTSVKVKEANLEVLPSLDAAELQAAVDAAPAGSRVLLPQGKVLRAADGAPLVVRKALTLDGKGHNTTLQAGATGTTLDFPIRVEAEGQGSLLLSRFSTTAPMLVTGPELTRARLFQVTVDLRSRRGQDDDALTLRRIGRGYKEGLTLLEECQVVGGADGVLVDTTGCVLKRCLIYAAQSRGVFANSDFVVDGCTIQGCGGYGMKTRMGCERRGENDIQPGPWDNAGYY
eukprot:CAMPEP_0172639946 /NCGR_PEP_ID=MMETSP1068-20121228/220638_1 /TAXON_ID=35684 /ORGANISM="Pseudopedinella elastica, Strain CCMP716" /LENGTH=434 /DNA_ID=CAMNT_0013453207 /DNA_START=51 /DNA_END=1355 /DNA_ORIENTATION=+